MTLPTAPDSTVAYLRSLGAVRDRSKQVYDLIVAGNADHWDWDESKLQTVVDFCAGLIQVSSEAPETADASATLGTTPTAFLVSSVAFLRPLSRYLHLVSCPALFISAYRAAARTPRRVRRV